MMKLLQALWQDESGQGMTEYAVVLAGIMGGLLFMGFSFLPKFIGALQQYYDSHFIILNLPIP